MFFGKKKDASEAWKAQGKGTELRAHPRMSLKTLVTVRTAHREAHCKLHDLSLGGLAFIAPWQLAPNDPVSLTLNPPEGLVRIPRPPAVIDARVCRVIPSPRFPGSYQTGVRFVSPSSDAKSVIKMWFESFGEESETGGRQRSR